MMSDRDAQTIKESKDVQMSFDGTIARLSVKSARCEMSGTYTCQITNEFGKEESSAELVVTGNLMYKIVRLKAFLLTV